MYPNRTTRWLLIAILPLLLSAAASAQALISVNFGPPALPVYYQPRCPAQGYFWAPGYWAWSPVGYYWVPGTWVLAPEPGLLWTPGYWAYNGGGLYYWHPGYWAPVVGYYGGINYGYGYPGAGYYGGYWRGRAFYYNQTVNNVNITNVQNVYNQTVIRNTTVVSYNGGPGGTKARPTPEQEAAARQQHVAPTAAQTQHEHAASTNRELLASVNQGRPPIAATPKPAEFSGRGVVAADRAGAPYKAPSNALENRAGTAREVPRPPTSVRPSEAPAARENSVPRPPNLPRPETEPRSGSAPQPSAPRPEHESKRQSAPQPESIPRPQNAPRPEAAPHPQSPARPQNESPKASRPQPQNKPQKKETPVKPKNPPPNAENRPQ